MLRLFVFLIASLVFLAPFSSNASQPTKIIVLFGPGGTSDVIARYFANKLTDKLNESVVVENRPGANGIVGISAVTRAPSDGKTLLVGTNTPLSVLPAIEKDLPFDPLTDLTPVSGLVRVSNVFVVAADSKFKNLAGLVSSAKKTPSKLTIGTFSVGHQLTVQWLSELAGIKLVNVPYKGAGEILTNLIGGQIDVASIDLPAAAPLLRSGKVRALALSGEDRSEAFPDIPTVRESYPDYVSYSWIAFYIRAKSPTDDSKRLTEAVQEILKLPETKTFISGLGAEPMPLDPHEMHTLQKTEIDRFKRLAQTAGMATK